MEYDFTALDVNNPTPKWVLSEVTVKDGYDKINDGHDAYIKKFVYEDGYYDRRERDFFGFGTVKTIDFENYRMSVSKFHNRNYFLAGLLKESYVTRSIDENSLFSKTENTYELKSLDQTNMKLLPSSNLALTFDTGGTEGRRSCAALLTKTKNYLYELHSTPMLTTEENFEYDALGRVAVYNNLGNIDDVSDNYKSEISYHNNASLVSKHILNVPQSIIVSQSGAIKRKRTTGVDNNTGAITSINAYNSLSNFSTTDMQYGNYGNLVKILYPENENNQRMTYDYTYDTAFNKYVVQIEDAFGYVSAAGYNDSFDKIETTTDMAGNQIQYQYDIFGRNTLIIAPKEQSLSKPYTLIFSYYPKFSDLPTNSGVSAATFVPVAVTYHFDSQHPGNEIETYCFIDGLARPLQVKKDIHLNTGTAQNPNFQEALSVSGKTAYDAYGRGIEHYLPYYEIKSESQKFLLNEYAAPYFSQVVYDELDRTVKTVDQEGNSSMTNYSIDEDLNQTMAIRTRSVTDQNGAQEIITESYKDVNGRVISTMNQGLDGPLWTQFKYNAIGELLSYVDAEGLVTTYKYDLMGRKASINHPDNGITSFYYDQASNMTKLQTANLVAYGSGYINYSYDFNRLSEIKYPDMPLGANISNVTYEYGSSGNETGRLLYQKDATGIQEFKYGNMGEVIENKRTVIAPNLPARSFNTSFTYDSWNRIQSMTYPDGEKVNYNYDLGGNLTNIQGYFRNEKYYYVRRIDYDFYEQRQYISYGNNTETFYEYTPTLRRLNSLQTLSGTQESLFSNQYSFDKVGNVTAVANSSGANSANQMGGAYSHYYSYDNLNRLAEAEGSFQGGLKDIAMGTNNSTYKTSLKYNATHGIAEKNQEHSRDGNAFEPNTYKNTYEYHEGTHKLKSLYDSDTALGESFEYDSNGNTLYSTKSNGEEKKYFWDESNRLRALADQNGMTHYIYDASGERVLKGSSDIETLHENGSPANGGVVFNAYKTYPSAFIVVDGNGQYSKHYYAGSERVVSRIGDQNSDIFNLQTVLGARQGFDPKALQQLQMNDLKTLADSAKIGKVAFKEPKTEKANADETHRAPEPGNIYFFHPDHLGTATYLTDINGNPYQFFLNLPFGETMAEQHSLSENYENPFKFNGKELDDETGLYYYGARYYDPRISVWLSVDPLAEKHPDESPFIYCGNNPIIFIDPDGMDRIYSSSGKLIKDTGKGNLIKVRISGNEYNLSQLNYNKYGTKKAVARIIATEATAMGYSGVFGVKKMENKDKGGETTADRQKVYINTYHLAKGTYDKYTDLRSVLYHEGDPKYGHKSENPTSKYTFTQHANVYLNQSKTTDFYNSSEQNQYSVAYGFALRAITGQYNGEGSARELIDDFNKFHGGNLYIDFRDNSSITNSYFTIYGKKGELGSEYKISEKAPKNAYN